MVIIIRLSFFLFFLGITGTKISNIKLSFIPSFLNRKEAFLCP